MKVMKQVKIVRKDSVITFTTEGVVAGESRKGIGHRTGAKGRISKGEMKKNSTYKSNIKRLFSRDLAEVSAALSTTLDAAEISQKYAKYKT